jgi:Tol biopolymer transport system component
VAAQIIPGATRLVRVSADGKRVTPLTSGSFDEQWTEPRWSHAGDRIVASRWLRGNIAQIVVVDDWPDRSHGIERNVDRATPSWLPNDAGILYSSDRTGTAQVYAERSPTRGHLPGLSRIG